jgi:hypothetical protein
MFYCDYNIKIRTCKVENLCKNCGFFPGQARIFQLPFRPRHDILFSKKKNYHPANSPQGKANSKVKYFPISSRGSREDYGGNN